MKTLIRYSDLYSDKCTSIDELVSGVDKREIVIALIYLSRDKVLINSSIFAFLNCFFSDANKKYVDEIISKVNAIQFQVGNLDHYMVYSELTCLRLCEKIMSINDVVDNPSKHDLEINLFKSLLVINEEIIIDNKSVDDLIKKGGRLNYSKVIFYSSLPTHDILNYNLNFEFMNESYKALMLFKFLKSYERFKPIVERLLREYNCKNENHYMRLMFASVLPEIISSNQGNKILNYLRYDRNNFVEDLQFRFMEKIALSEYPEVEDLDLVNLRTRPLLKENESSFLVISDLFLCQLIHNSVYFKLNDIFKEVKKTDKLDYDFRGVYCLDYSEKYLLYHVLENIYSKKSYKRLTGNSFEEMKLYGMTDYYIRNGNKLMLIESKNALFPAKLKYAKDYASVEDIIVRNYFEDKSSKKKDKKAILQLIESIKMVLKGALATLDNNLPSKPRFYPIIVSHNKYTEIHGFNLILNSWYINSLEELINTLVNRINSMPLTVINIDTLIYFQDNFKLKEFDLFQIIEEYHKYVEFNAEDSVKYGNIENFKKKLISFDVYVFDYMNSRKKMQPPLEINQLIHELR